MHLEITMLSEVSQMSETPTSNAINYMWKIKKGYNDLPCRTDTESRTLKNLWFPNETGWGWGMGWEFGKEML